jgi:ornithine carbamoyltransferase
MNKSFMAGVTITLMVVFGVSIIMPSPNQCEASKEAQTALSAQQVVISDLAKVVSDAQDVLKKSVVSMGEAIKACGK